MGCWNQTRPRCTWCLLGWQVMTAPSPLPFCLFATVCLCVSLLSVFLSVCLSEQCKSLMGLNLSIIFNSVCVYKTE